MMKYFTLDGWISDQDPRTNKSTALEAVREYREYLAKIRRKLPAGLRRLIDEFCLCDGSLRELVVDVPSATARLRFDAGDVTMREGKDISLHYCGPIVIVPSFETSRRVAGIRRREDK